MKTWESEPGWSQSLSHFPTLLSCLLVHILGLGVVVSSSSRRMIIALILSLWCARIYGFYRHIKFCLQASDLLKRFLVLFCTLANRFMVGKFFAHDCRASTPVTLVWPQNQHPHPLQNATKHEVKTVVSVNWKLRKKKKAGCFFLNFIILRIISMNNTLLFQFI